MKRSHAELGSLLDCSVSWETADDGIETTHYCNHTPNHTDMQHECGCGATYNGMCSFCREEAVVGLNGSLCCLPHFNEKCAEIGSVIRGLTILHRDRR